MSDGETATQARRERLHPAHARRDRARYRRDAGIGTMIAMMVPYAVIMTVVWIAFCLLRYVIGIPLGPGSPV